MDRAVAVGAVEVLSKSPLRLSRFQGQLACMAVQVEGVLVSGTVAEEVVVFKKEVLELQLMEEQVEQLLELVH